VSSLADSGRINQRKLRGCYPSIEINACVDEGNADPVTVVPQETTQGSTDLKISAHIIRAGPMKPMVGKSCKLCDLSRLGLYLHLRVAQKARSHRALCFLDRPGKCERYFITSPTFETKSEKYGRVNGVQAVGNALELKRGDHVPLQHFYVVGGCGRSGRRKKAAPQAEIARSAVFFRCCRRGHAQESHPEPCRPAFQRARPPSASLVRGQNYTIVPSQGRTWRSLPTSRV
jgi:hypothetical protein